MNSTYLIESTITVTNSTMTTIETWFIPFDILMVLCTTSVIILATLFLCIIIFDKTCHTVPMMLIANSCATALVFGCILLSMSIFTLKNDLKQIEYEDSLCNFRVYLNYVSAALFHYSILLQALYRYITVVYRNRLFWQSAKFQFLAICSTWIFSFIYPIAFMFTGEIQYNVDNQICQLPLRLSFSIIYTALWIYIIPMSMIMFIYFKLVLYVHEISKRVTPMNVLFRAQRQLKIVQRTFILIIILLILGIPYATFVFISYFTSPPKYHFRISFIFIDVSLVFVMIVLFQFTDPLKASVMKKIKRRPNAVVARIT